MLDTPIIKLDSSKYW